MRIVTLDVGGTAIKSALFVDGKITCEREIPSEGKRGRDILLSNIHRAIQQYKDFDAIGISTTGQVSREEGMIVYANENVPNYTGTKLRDLLEESYGCKVVMENDVNSAALGEAKYGAGVGEDHFLCITYGTGVGGSVILHQDLYKGANGIAGEVGHIITHPQGNPCACGGRGCYEQYASTTHLVKMAQKQDKEITSGRILFERFSENPDSLKNLIDEWIDEVVLGLISMIHTMNPSAIVLGGGVMKQPYVVTQVQNRVKNLVMDSFSDIKICSAKLGNQAGMYGVYYITSEECEAALRKGRR